MGRDAGSLGQAATNVDSGDDILPVDIALMLILTKRRMPRYGAMSTSGWKLHDTIIAEEAEEAFRAKTYTIRLEAAPFPSLAYQMDSVTGIRFTSRLTSHPTPTRGMGTEAAGGYY